MSRVGKILSDISELLSPLNTDQVMAEFQDRIDLFSFKDVSVLDVDCDYSGNCFVTFGDSEGDQLTAAFYKCQMTGSAKAMLITDDSDEVAIIEFSGYPVSFIKSSTGEEYVNLTDLSWLNKSAFESLLKAGDIGRDGEPLSQPEFAPEKLGLDIYGEKLGESFVMSRGKKLKLPIVSIKSKGELSAEESMVMLSGKGRR